MNAAARFANQNTLSRGFAITIDWAAAQFITMSLLLAVFTSALSVVYIANSSRSINAGIQQTLSERNRLHVQWEQLLLEKSTQVVQARVQHIAENKLGMEVPERKLVKVIVQG